MKKALFVRAQSRCLSWWWLVPAGLLLAGCMVSGGGGDGQPGPGDMQPDNGDDGSDGNGNDGDGDNGNGNNGGGTPTFGTITGTEEFVEGTRSDDGNGGSRRRDERFTATWSLTATSAEESEVFIGDVLTTMISGDLEGQGQLTYAESGSNFDPQSVCPSDNYAGEVEWNAEVTGTYSWIPAIGELSILARAGEVSSPEYQVSYTYTECPEVNSMSPSQYVWPGPGQGTWGFVTIVLSDGEFENRVENPFGNDLGAEDYYEIRVESSGAP